MASAETYRLLFQASTQGVDSLTGIERALAGVEKTGNSAAGSLNAMDLALGAIGGKAGILISIGTAAAVAVGTVAKLAAETARLAEEQQNVAIRTGLTIREVGQFSQLANEAGVNAGAFTSTMRTLSRALSENTDEGQQAKAVMRQYGVELTNVYGAALPTREIFIRLGETLGKIEDPAKRAEVAIKVLGRSGLELLPALRDNARETLAEMEKLGIGFSQSGAEQALKLDSSLDQLDRRYKALRQTVSEFTAEIANKHIESFKALASIVSPSPGQPNVTFGGVTIGLPLTPESSFPFGVPRNSPLGRFGGSDFPTVGLAGPALQAANQQSINLILANRGTRTDQLTTALQAAERALAQAIRDTDVAAVRSGVTRVESLKRQIEAIKEAQREQERLLRIQIDPNDPALRSGTFARTGALGLDAARAGIAAGLGDFGTGAAVFAGRPIESEAARSNASVFIQESERAARLREDIAQRSRDQELAFRERIIELQSGPGGELATAQQIYALRIGAAQTQAEIEQANYELSLRTLEVMKQREATLRFTGQDFVRSILSGQGISGFLRNQGANILSTIGGNAAVQLFSGTSLSLTRNPNSTAGRLLAGTPFGADPLAGVTNLNTVATQQNTAAIVGLSTALATGTLGGGGLSALGIPSQVFSGVGTNPLIFSQNAAASRNVQIGREGLDYLSGLGISSASTSSAGGFKEALGKAAFYGAAAAGGTIGAIAGFKEGGARGNVNAIASILGAASAIPGPQQPFIAAGALAAGLIGGLLPDRRRSRENEISRMLDEAAFSGPSSQQFDIGTGGGGYDFDFRGGRRAAPIQIFVNAMDSKSFVDHSADIADAVRVAINGGHPINDTMRREVLAQ